MNQKIKRLFKKLTKIVVGLGGGLLLLHLIFPLKVAIEYAPIVLAKDSTPLYTWMTKDQQWRMYARLDEITPELKKAIVYKEDKRFYFHPGIDVFSLIRAALANAVHFKRTSGASTITMQVARMLNRKPRTYTHKLVEMFRALQLEIKFSKDEILQLYLNLLPYGSNIQGVKAASLLYFDKSPDQLSLAEITALSIIPNKPNYRVMGKDNDKIVAERNIWLKYFEKDKLFDTKTIAAAINEPLNAYRHEAPKTAPQMAWRLRQMYPQEAVIYSCIDAKAQRKAEAIVSNYLNALQMQGVYNASVMVIDNNTHQVLTYIGSNDFDDKLHHGEVDGVKAKRSPGSALKPILYGLAIDNGLITPKTIIADVPINIAGYCPENYDLGFRGNVTIEDALRQSLNIPAVKMLQQLGLNKMLQLMQQSGFTTIQQKKYKLGLSMILGGCEIRLDELCNFYAALSRGGLYKDIDWIISPHAPSKSKPNFDTNAKRVLSESASFMITQILSELNRPDLPNMAANALQTPHIAWKTGTSYGRKDAWSIGYNQRMTIGVWVGNFNGQSAPGLSGAGTATPLLFQLFNALDKNNSNNFLPTAPKDLSMRLVCVKTGKVPQEHCEEQISDWYIPGVSSVSVCDHLRKVYLSVDEQYSYCTTCVPANGYKIKYYENISPELGAFYSSKKVKYTSIPEHNPNCSRLFDGEAPRVTSVQDGMTYIVLDKQQELQLDCTTANGVQQVYWYLNDQYIGRAAKGAHLFFVPKNPKIKITCTDDQGRSSSIQIKVKFL